jgi:hypothetical protein
MIDLSTAPETFGRRTGVLRALGHISERPNPIIVETGTTRGRVNGGGGPYYDGWATIAWGWFCQKKAGHCFSIDLDFQSLAECRRITADYADSITCVHGDSATFLSVFGRQIDLLYLDSADDPNVCYREFLAAQDRLFQHSVVLIDDTDPKQGKGLLTVPYMESRGWGVEYIRYDNERQALLVRL